MGESERYLDYKRKKISFGEDGNALTMLISINGVVFILLTFVKILYYLLQLAPGAFESNILPWFTMPARLSALAYRPWTFFSYMFTHTGLIVTLTNMLWLWVFGSVLQNIAGNRKLIPVYIYGGITGACVFIAANYLIPTLKSSIDVSTLEGANAAILSVAVATTALAPDHRFFKMLNGGIPLWVITLLYVIIDFAGIAGAGAAYHIAHLAGGFIGFMFVFNLRKGKDWSLWINELYNWFINLFNPDKIDSVKRKKE